MKKLLAVGIIAGAIALVASKVSAQSGGGGPTKPTYWVSPPYPSFPPTWWGSSWAGAYVLVTRGGGNSWIFPESVPEYVEGGWTIVP